MHAPNAYPTPDWVMVGATMPPNGRFPDGCVRIIASTELNQAELTSQAEDWITSWSYAYPVPMRYSYGLTVDMRTYVIIEADSYATAFQRLFATWSPEPDADRASIERRRAMLERVKEPIAMGLPPELTDQ